MFKIIIFHNLLICNILKLILNMM